MARPLQQAVLAANLRLVTSGLVRLTWGNVSGLDPERGIFYIKPSGVGYDSLRAEDMVGVRVADGAVVEGSLRPSSDTPTHLALYRAWGRPRRARAFATPTASRRPPSPRPDANSPASAPRTPIIFSVRCPSAVP